MTAPHAAGARRPTAMDVARRAGVSRTTVSFVLNDRTEAKGITPATAERVLEAASALGYLPDRTARMLRSGTSDLVVFATPRSSALGSLALQLITQVGEGLSEVGLHLIIRRVPSSGAFEAVWRDLSPAAVMGLEIPAADVAHLDAAGIPSVSFDNAAFDTGVGTVQCRHLLERGHRGLAFAAPLDPELQTYAQRRLDGVRRTCLEAGVPPPAVVDVGLDLASGTAAVRALRDHEGVTAVCAYNDDHAFAVLAGMAALGLRAPDDLAVIGADNIPLSELAVPSLTTVDPLGSGMVPHLVRRVQGAITGGPAPEGGPSVPLRVLARRST